MKQPSLEEVKEYFKNAKKVKCLWNKQKVNITKKIIKEAYKNCSGDVWIVIDGHTGGGVLLYNEITSEYAEILTYKEKTFSITESQIKDFYKITEIHSAQKYIEKLFPETVEFNLKIGKWYKSTISESIAMFNGINKESYGIHTSGKEWIQSHKWFFTENEDLKKWREATDQEVLESLKNEAVKRGLVHNVWIKGMESKEPKLLQGQCFGISHDLKILSLYYDVFVNGKWAEIIPTINLNKINMKTPIQELQKKLVSISDDNYLNGSKHDSDVIDSVGNIVRNEFLDKEKDHLINAFMAGQNETGPEAYKKALNYYTEKYINQA